MQRTKRHSAVGGRSESRPWSMMSIQTAEPRPRHPTPIAAWVALGLFFVAVDVIEAIYWLAGANLAPGALLLLRGASLTLTWNWLEQECAPYGQTYPLDMGLFLYTIGFLLIPYYMWRNQRWVGVVKTAALIGMWLAAYALATGTEWLAQLLLG
jgi:hypothetical protein